MQQIGLFYSGASAFNAIQNNPDKSLGGWMSSTQIPNSALDNLFSLVSERAQSEQLAEVKGVFLVNNGTVALANLFIHIEQDADDIVQFEFSAVTVPNSQSMEKIPSVRSSPFYAEFFTANGVDNKALLLDNFAINQVIGLWIRRTSQPKPAIPIVTDFTNQNDAFNVWYNKQRPAIEQPSIILSWD